MLGCRLVRVYCVQASENMGAVLQATDLLAAGSSLRAKRDKACASEYELSKWTLLIERDHIGHISAEATRTPTALCSMEPSLDNFIHYQVCQMPMGTSVMVRTRQY